MAIKVMPVEINGEMRVHPDVIDLLTRFAQHCEYCDECTAYRNTLQGDYCEIGRTIILDLEKQPSVSFVPEPNK